MRNMNIALSLAALAAAPAAALQDAPPPPHAPPHAPHVAAAPHLPAPHAPPAPQVHVPAAPQVHVPAVPHVHVPAAPHAPLPPHLDHDLHAWDALVLPPESWAPQDPADSLWRAARTAMNENNPAAAAAMYRRIRTESRFSGSAYRPASFYWEAFARHRTGSTAEMRTAREVLAQLRRTHPDYENMGDVDRLQSRIDSDLARQGDAQAGSRVAANVSQAAATQCPDQEMRTAVLESLITMPANSALPILQRLMARKDDCNAPLREKAVFIIAQHGAGEAADLLLDIARTDPSMAVREQAVFWLSQVDTDRAVDAIGDILRNSTTDASLMEKAVFALSQHSSPRAAQMLRDVAGRQGASREARKQAIFWLGQRSGAESAAFIRTLYAQLDDSELKDAAIFAISQRPDEASGDFLLGVAMDEGERVEARKQALFWAGQQRGLSIDRLSELYTRMSDREMKNQVIFVLSQRSEPAALTQMMQIARDERDVELRKQAIFWIGQSSDPRATRFLADLIGG